ncbi:MAG: hypothetical protein ACO3KD_06985 [Gaiellales bacterium]
MREAESSAAQPGLVDTAGDPPLDDVERWIGERIHAPGDEGPIRAGTLWAGAYADAVREMAEGLASPSAEYRRRYALPLGLQRMLAEDEPHLQSGLALRPHQVDALAGMLAALVGDFERADDADGAEGEADEAEARVADESTAVVGASARGRGRGGRGRRGARGRRRGRRRRRDPRRPGRGAGCRGQRAHRPGGPRRRRGRRGRRG